jgi:hypothetical protein
MKEVSGVGKNYMRVANVANVATWPNVATIFPPKVSING